MEELRVSPDDRAFYFGDGVYEVVKVLDGKFFAADLHLDRLYRSAAGIELEIPWTKDEIMSVLAKLVADGLLEASVLSQGSADGDPLGFLVAEGGAASITDAAYRYARHEKGADVILFGTGNRAHVKANIESILRPPLPAPVIERLHRTFGHLSGVGLDLPGPVKT
jgi:branched-subunit amino acid aminotransferase/4-amino-4-deoxychorismate lyase